MIITSEHKGKSSKRLHRQLQYIYEWGKNQLFPIEIYFSTILIYLVVPIVEDKLSKC